MSGKIEPYEQFAGTVLEVYRGHEFDFYKFETDKGETVSVDASGGRVRVYRGTKLILSGRRKTYGGKEWIDAFYVRVLDNSGKVIVEYPLEDC